MKSRPLITVVVLNRNYAKYVACAIESALAQTYEQFEVLVVDNGSTDDSLAVIGRYADRVRVLALPQTRLEQALNRGVEEAGGLYFARLDADDVLEPEYLETLWTALERSPDAAYAYCRPMFFGARHGPMRCLPFSAYFLVRRTNFVNSAALTSRADHQSVGGYTEGLPDIALEDWDFFLKMLEAGKRGTYVRTHLLRWRRHEQGSRNPEGGEALSRATATMRARHGALSAATDDLRGRLYYLIDLALAAADQVVGFSRWPRAVQLIERASWRRFQRWHAPKVKA